MPNSVGDSTTKGLSACYEDERSPMLFMGCWLTYSSSQTLLGFSKRSYSPDDASFPN